MTALQLPRFHTIAVADVKQETQDAISIAFLVPPDLREDYIFAAGQYLTLRKNLGGTEIRRSYSICSGPDDNELRIAIKRVDGGVFSGWANDSLAKGDFLDVMTPTGRFGIVPDGDRARVYACFAAGSGITPILSIIRALLSRDKVSTVFLFYGNRSTADMLFREALEALKDQHMGRLSVFHVLSQEQQDIPILTGRLDQEKIDLLLRYIVPASSVDHAFVCGPAGMSDDVQAALFALGLRPDQIHVERFVSALGGKPRVQAKQRINAAPSAAVRLVVDGRQTEVPVRDGESVLDAALRAGMDLPYACKGGMCSTCRARVIEGAVEMDLNFSLEPWEVEAGFVLTCQAHPTTAGVIIDYDHV